MSNNYSGNLRGCYERSEVDWFAQFIQVWIPFNAWYRSSYPNLNQERQVLDELKKRGNLLYNRVTHLFNSDYAEAHDFRNYVAMLHTRLTRQTVENRNRPCSFEAVDVGQNPKTFATEAYRRMNYEAQFFPRSNNGIAVEARIKNSSGLVICQIQLNQWDQIDFDTHPNIRSIDREKATRLRNCFMQVRPRIIESLLYSGNDDKGLKFGSYQFRSDNDTIVFAGIIEIIYSLRNLLFHGEITPDQQNNEIYEPAYHIVRTMVKCVI